MQQLIIVVVSLYLTLTVGRVAAACGCFVLLRGEDIIAAVCVCEGGFQKSLRPLEPYKLYNYLVPHCSARISSQLFVDEFSSAWCVQCRVQSETGD